MTSPQRSPVLHIAAAEVRHHWRQRTAAPAALLLLLLLGGAFAVSVRQQQQLERQQQAYQQMVEREWMAQPDRHPHRVAHYGYLVFRPPSPLRYFDPGIEPFAGNSVFLEAHRQNAVNFSEAHQSEPTLGFGQLSPALVLQWIAPLLVCFLGFAAVSRERESGTLALLLAQGVTWRQLLAGKALGMSVLTLGVALPALLLLARRNEALLLLPAYTVYLLIFAVLAVWVSASQRSSRRSLNVLLCLWVCWCVLLPRAAVTAGAALHPVPSRLGFDTAMEAELARLGDSHNPNDPHFAELKENVLREHNVRDVKDLPFNYGAYVMEEAEKLSSAAFRRLYGAVLTQFENQERYAGYAALADPYLAIRNLSMTIAGTSLTQFQGFQSQTEEYRYAMVQRLNGLHKTRIQMTNDRAQKVGSEEWRQFPPFVYQPQPLRERMAAAAPYAALLSLWLAVPLCFLFRLRMPPLR
jgi:ABC-2 type transport system permease protein